MSDDSDDDPRTIVFSVGTFGFVVLTVLAALGLARVFEILTGAI